jgi:hypothetical protein
VSIDHATNCPLILLCGTVEGWLTWADERARLCHYRTKEKLEVDAVLETPDGRLVGVEVKAGATVREKLRAIPMDALWHLTP